MSDLSKRLKKLLRKDYRDEYLASVVRSGIAYQIQALRKKFGLSQEEFAKRIGKPQSTVSRLERTEYGKVSVQTLLDVAAALDVALIVKFSDYPALIEFAAHQSVADLQPDTIEQSGKKLNVSPRSKWIIEEVYKKSGQPDAAPPSIGSIFDQTTNFQLPSLPFPPSNLTGFSHHAA